MKSTRGEESLRIRGESAELSEGQVTVALVSSEREDHSFIQCLFDHSHWRLHHFYTISEAADALTRRTIPVIITRQNLIDGNWRRLLNTTSKFTDAPRILVMAPESDTDAWAEVFDQGANDVLALPLNDEELYRVISFSWLGWKNARRLSAAKLSPLSDHSAHELRAAQ